MKSVLVIRLQISLAVILIFFFCSQGLAKNSSLIPTMSLLLLVKYDCNDVRKGTAYLDNCGKCVGGDTDNSACTIMHGGKMWQQADDEIKRQYAAAVTYCDELELGNYSDWYLPSYDELKGLVVCTDGTPTPLKDYPTQPFKCGSEGSYESPTIDAAFHADTDRYWTSYESSSYRIAIDFSDGEAYVFYQPYTYLTRCVR
ncbi:Major paralogous domain-containing protein [Candidatus Electrothrix aarhusensis]